MAQQSDNAELPLIDRAGRIVAWLHILVAGDASGAIEILSEQEAGEYGEERVQLRENGSYEYQLIPVQGETRQLCLAEDGVTARSRIRSKLIDTGRIEPKGYTGLLPLVLLDAIGHEVTRTNVEVRSVKLSYREDYRQMLQSLAERSMGILLQMTAPANLRITPDTRANPETLYQRFAFVRALINSKAFREAVERVVAAPKTALMDTDHSIPVSRARLNSGSMLRRLAYEAPRMHLPLSHPLSLRLHKKGVSELSVPAYLTEVRRTETIDIPENRFVKHVLTTFADYVGAVEQSVKGSKPSKARTRIMREARAVLEYLNETLTRNFFKDVSALRSAPIANIALQRRAGYREVLRAWLEYDLATKLVWQGGEDVFGAGKRDVAVLYEYWLFFELLDIVAATFKLPKPPPSHFIEPTLDGFGLKLKTGKGRRIIAGGADIGGRHIHVELSYNKTFSYQANPSHVGSWTRIMRPDFTLTFRPLALTDEAAEQMELITHVHFDAKYKAESVFQLFGSESDDIPSSLYEKERRTYLRADLLKMHSYKDAIRRAAGAYVLYPGSDESSQVWHEYYEILPGVGAFVMRPSPSGTVGAATLRGHFTKLAEHISNRAAQRETISFHVQKVHSDPVLNIKGSYLPETFQKERMLPPSEHLVLLTEYEHTCLSEILRQSLFPVPLGRLSSSSTLKLALPRHILGYDSQCLTTSGLLSVISASSSIRTASQLSGSGLIGSCTEDTVFLLIKVERDATFDAIKWNPMILQNHHGGMSILTLAELLHV